MKVCSGCRALIAGAPLLVPRGPRGVFRYCTRSRCTNMAQRRAKVAWPMLSGKRGTKGRRT